VAERSRNPVIESVEAVRPGYSEVTPRLDWVRVEVKLSDIEGLLGVKVNPDVVVNLLGRMGYEASCNGEVVEAQAPPYRIDVHDAVDVIEDVAIGLGYGNIEPSLPPPTHFGAKHPVEVLSNLVRELLVGMGLQEVVNFNLISDEAMVKAGFQNFVKLKNPKIRDYSALRSSLIPSLLLTAKVNQRLVGRLEAFEVGDVIEVKGDTATTDRRVGVLLMGDGFTLTDGLSIVKSLLRYLGLDAGIRRYSGKPFINVRSVEVLVNGVSVGVVGEVDPEVLVDLGIEKPLVVGELSLGLIMGVLKGLKGDQ